MPKILHLTLKKEWFDMIASDEKKEEYRELKPYWWNRLIERYDPIDGELITRRYDIVRFKNGYSKNCPEMDVEFIETRIAKTGVKEWGYPGKCLGIKLGKILSIKNYTN